MTEVLIFAAQAIVVFLVIAGIILLIALLVAKSQQSSEVQITPLHDKWKDLGFFLKSFTAGKDELKQEKKKLKKERKAESKGLAPVEAEGNIYSLKFEGDIQASQVKNLREEITAILQVATPKDEVVVSIKSPGGQVTGYGLAAAQLLRLRNRGLRVTACVDEVAASGGYLMACTASQIIAAPFAIVGSIGVVAQVPNFHRFLKKHDVDVKEYTAGEFKRTVSIVGEITPVGEQKFKEQLEETHVLFKDFVQTYRPKANIPEVSTGEYWYGKKAIDLGLVDDLKTSDDYLLEKFALKHRVYAVECENKVSLSEKISELVGASTRAIFKSVHKGIYEESEKLSQHRPF